MCGMYALELEHHVTTILQCHHIYVAQLHLHITLRYSAANTWHFDTTLGNNAVHTLTAECISLQATNRSLPGQGMHRHVPTHISISYSSMLNVLFLQF